MLQSTDFSKSATAQCRLAPHIFSRLENKARSEGVSVSELIRTAIRRELQDS
jgi:predicted HicB family RNase H-like nuclease